MNLEEVVSDICKGLISIDRCGEPCRVRQRTYQLGVGPYTEDQLVRRLAAYLNQLSKYKNSVRKKQKPDLLIQNEWALEFKIARPFNDNGTKAEHWSVNLLHPYPGNESSIGDCYKLIDYEGPERKGVIVVGYEHSPARIDLSVLVDAFELLAEKIAKMKLSPRIEPPPQELIYPVMQSLRLFAWEVLSKA